MIELKFRAPFYIWKDTDDVGDPIPCKVGEREIFLIGGCFNQTNGFHTDLSDFVDPLELRVHAILPHTAYLDETGPYLEIRAYSCYESLSDKDIEKITEYIRGQVADGWGEGGFALWDRYYLDFIWNGVTYNGCRIIEDQEYVEIYKEFCSLASWNFIHHPYYDEKTGVSSEDFKDIANALRNLTESLDKIDTSLKELTEKEEVDFKELKNDNT